MKLLVIAVGTRMPEWVDAGFADYARRMPRHLPLELIEIRPEPRSGRGTGQILAAEAERIRQAVPRGATMIALDEHGSDLATARLAQRLEQWMAGGSGVALVIGGPDGLAEPIKRAAAQTIRLSSLTLPHGLVRVVLAEQLYRAASLLANHPYHRP